MNLSADQIEEIIGLLRPIGQAIPSAQLVLEDQRAWSHRKKLKNVKIPVGKFPEFKAKCDEIFKRSQSQVGEGRGMIIAEAIGQSLTQMMLKSFHVAGLSGGIVPVQRVTQIFGLTDKLPQGRSTLHLKVKTHTMRSFMEASASLISVRLTDLLSATPWSFFSKANPQWWHELSLKHFDQRGEIRSLMGQFILRLNFDLEKLATTGRSIPTIAAAIQEALPHVKLLPSPTFEGKIDVMVSHEAASAAISSMKVKEPFSIQEPMITIMSYFMTIFIPSLSLEHGGIKGFRHIHPEKYNVMNMISHEEKIGDTWRLHIDEIEARFSGVPIDRLIEIAGSVGLELRLHEDVGPIFTERYFDVRNEGSAVALMNTSPENLREYYFGVVEGINFIDMLLHPLVDGFHSNCDDPRQIFRCFGMSGFKAWIERELYLLVTGSGQKISPLHYSMIAAHMSFRSTPTPISAKGTWMQGRGALSEMAFADPKQVAMKYAITGASQSVASLGASMTLGQVPRVGTGFSKVFITFKDQVRSSCFSLRDIVKGEMSPPPFLVKKASTLLEFMF